MMNKSIRSSMITLIFILIILLSHPMHPQSDAAMLTSRLNCFKTPVIHHVYAVKQTLHRHPIAIVHAM
ncbi:hypothetical protein Lser_V15G18001 [Lactuca serriola]